MVCLTLPQRLNLLVQSFLTWPKPVKQSCWNHQLPVLSLLIDHSTYCHGTIRCSSSSCNIPPFTTVTQVTFQSLCFISSTSFTTCTPTCPHYCLKHRFDKLPSSYNLLTSMEFLILLFSLSFHNHSSNTLSTSELPLWWGHAYPALHCIAEHFTTDDLYFTLYHTQSIIIHHTSCHVSKYFLPLQNLFYS